MTKKTYCVHVYPRMLDYENIEARSPEEAKMKVLDAEWPDTDEYERVEVMRQCGCGTDNDVADKRCAECGETL